MDKLQPLIVHRFWILAGAAVLLPLIGWFMGAGQLAAEIDERKQKIDAIHGKSYSGEIENDKWAAGLKEINQRQERSNNRSAAELWLNQERLKVWPNQVRHLMGDVEHFGKIHSDALAIYKASYDSILLRMFRVVEPQYYNPAGTAFKTRIAADNIQAVPEDAWEGRNPTSQEIWEAQEDVWLTTSLLRAIAEVNADAENYEQAAVREIEQLTLHGGRPRGSAPAGGGAGGGMEGEYTGTMGEMLDMGGGQQFGDTGMGGRGRGGLQIRSAPFKPSDEFGDPSEASSGGGGMDDADGGAMSFSFGGANKKLRRYIEDDSDMPYKTRGFYLQVKMDHRKLPELMVRLTNSPWPVKITRVQQTMENRDDVLSPSGGGGAGGMRNYSDLGGMEDGMEGGMGGTPMLGQGGRGRGRNLFRNNTGRTGRQGLGGNPRGRTTPGGRTGSGQDPQALADQVMINNGLKDPNLAQVALTGVITIYQPPQEQALADASEQQDADAPRAADPDVMLDDDLPTLDDVAPLDSADPNADLASPPAADSVPADSVPADDGDLAPEPTPPAANDADDTDSQDTDSQDADTADAAEDEEAGSAPDEPSAEDAAR